MADLGSTRIFGKLTVIHSAILKANAEVTGDVTAASFAGDGSGLTGTSPLRATGTTSTDVGLGSVRNVASYSQTETDANFLGKTAKAADSDKLDNLDSTQFLRSDTNATLSGNLTVTGDVSANLFSGDGSGLTNIPGTAGWEYYGGTATLSTARTYRIVADTSTGAWTLTLPSTPSEGHSIDIADYAHTWDVNNLTVAGNGNTINGDTTLVCDVLAKSVTLVFWSGEWKMSF